MHRSIEDRTLEIANYIIENKCTVRKAASQFGISKSTVHKDVTQRLINIDRELYARVKIALEKNLQERHIRGGEATRQKYLYPTKRNRRRQRGREGRGGRETIRRRSGRQAEKEPRPRTRRKQKIDHFTYENKKVSWRA